MRFSLQIVSVGIPINCIIVISAYSVNQLLLAYHRRKTYFSVSSLFTVFPSFPYEFGAAHSSFHEGLHHNFVVIAPMIMKFGTGIKFDVFYTMVVKKFVTSLLLHNYNFITCMLANA